MRKNADLQIGRAFLDPFPQPSALCCPGARTGTGAMRRGSGAILSPEGPSRFPRNKGRFVMTTFTPLASLAGGAMIGIAAVLLMAFHGRIMGATGVLTGAFLPTGPGDRSWRIALLAGMISAPPIWRLVAGGWPVIDVPVPPAALVLGGLLVGIGVTLGGGCTSGHGVCGIARLSRRSVVATATFMASCLLTVFVIRHLIGA